MANAILHIKDSYYFEVPKFMWRSNRDDIEDFPRFWIRNDAEFQKWEAGRLYEHLDKLTQDTPSKDELIHDWEHWQHADHANYAKPLDVYLEERTAELREAFAKWQEESAQNADRGFAEYLREVDADVAWFARRTENVDFTTSWRRAKRQAGNEDAVAEFAEGHEWSNAKLEEYNSLLHGKILIPQPFANLRNAYQVESGFGISKFMIIEIGVALIVCGLFAMLAKRIQSGEPPKGRLWNMLEAFLLFIRDDIAKPTMGAKDATKFAPLLWTIFFFVLGCNLMGMVPWVGAPTGSFAVTLALAGVTIAAGMVVGMQKFGFVGFWLNLLPHMELPWWIGPPIKIVLFFIELLGYLIKHGVLAIRLLANMVAGHLVLLAIMGLAFSVEGAASDSWAITAVIAVVASTLFSVLELFVAFLQAYLFTFLSALFIAAATHHH